jgi:hypothetical protein
MFLKDQRDCPECQDQDAMNRRGFMRTLGGSAAILAAGAMMQRTPRVWADAQPAPANRQARPAEALVQELYDGLTNEQKEKVVMPWNHGAAANQLPTRLRMYNAAINSHNIGNTYTRPQQELVERILRSISSDEDGYHKISRGGDFDTTGSLQGCGAYIFGDPNNNHQFSWVFTGHHLTVRCDGNSEPDAAFGGPMYYGHSPNGYSSRNVFYYQTRSVLSVYEALTPAQRRQAVVTGTPGELAPSVRFRASGFPGISNADLTADQRRLIETVMRDVLSPFRRQDADEVMQIVRRNGGMERIHLAFYRDRDDLEANWHFWRLEGPGFVWNYRVLPHVHTYVNIAVA